MIINSSESSKKTGTDLLNYYINHGNLEGGYSLLIENEVDVNMKNNIGMTPLLLAVKNNNLSFTRLLLEFGANPNVKNDAKVGESSPMTIASENNYYEVASVLLDFGGNPNERDYLGYACLHLAARNGFLSLVILLLSRGADPQIRDGYGNTASYLAKMSCHYDLLEILPPPLTVGFEELYEYNDQVMKQTKGYTDDDIKKYQNQIAKDLKTKGKKK